MKTRYCIYIIAAVLLFINGCRNNDAEEQRLTWSSDEPLSIPYRVRFQRYERTNLIRNHSFETGKVFKLDSSTTSYVIDGWQQIGQNVYWTDTRNDSLFDYNDAYSGYRAVKISRPGAYETDTQGDGILSDFIKVIPGNYKLSLYERLENVMPLKARLGTRMNDGVDIRIQFYDRNKNLMNPGYGFPRIRQVINTSFKGLSFANYKSIRSLNWSGITGKSHHFPFPEGDIPSDAHFVRIFIGLKGTGTLWLDNVTFRYTDRNFSVAERMQLYTDTAFQTPEVFLPTPKKVTRMESVIFYKPGMAREQFPVILVPDTDNDALRAAAIIRDAFRNSMRGYHQGDSADIAPILSDASLVQNSGLVISVGNTAAYRTYLANLPLQEIEGHDDGYFIYSPSEDPHLVLLGANNGKGLFYAALTAAQMIDSRRPVFHNNKIIDYPDFPMRYFTMNTLEGDIRTITEQLVAYKFNGAFFLSHPADTGEIISSPSQADLLNIVPVAGYHPPYDSTLSYQYPLNYQANVTQAQGIYTIPPVFHNEMLDNSDFSEMCCQLPVNAKTIYSGSSFFSLNTDAADIIRYTSIMGPNPVFMDNSMLISTEWGQFAGSNGYYPGKIRLFNIFEPFINTDIQEFFPLLDSSLFVINLTANSEIGVIRLATAAEFLWNSSAYSKDFVLWKVLMTRYGAGNARDLIAWADKYAVLMEALLRVEMKVQVTRNIRSGQQYMVELTSLLSGISESLGSHHNLVKELQHINSGLRNRLGRLQTVQPAVRK